MPLLSTEDSMEQCITYTHDVGDYNGILLSKPL